MSEPAASTNSITLDQIEARMVDPSIIRKMVRGYFERVSKEPPQIDQNILTISCIDSRLPPARVLGQGHGQAYAIQTVANVVPRFDPGVSLQDQSIEVAAGIQYAVDHVGVKEIIILGHTDCGGAEARVVQDSSMTSVNRWMSHVCTHQEHLHAQGSISIPMLRLQHPQAYEALRRVSEREGLTTGLKNIQDMPFVAQAVKRTRLSLAALMCEMQEGRLELIDGDIPAFKASAELIRRFQTFKEEAWGQDGYMHDLVANGQRPKALIVTGISPYIAPENVFGIEPGDSFVHRRLGGHYQRREKSDGLDATIEFAVAVKQVESLVFVGHRHDVNQDYAEGKMDRHSLVSGFLEKCVPDIRQQRLAGMNPDDMHEQNLRTTYFNALKHPTVEQAVRDRKLSIALVLVDYENKSMEFYDPQNNEFREVVPPSL
ncbi:MAG: hypothetical protein IPH06_07520 [Alphaproteobacteria bacterium]|jgi:carbonic anhydrase|nr:hypothetical protein [Alphaproteobacteria bacterium]QQS57859.1 MAG: hypothetical protein IPN28_03280 [Alphaproteobacteria bacterium]